MEVAVGGQHVAAAGGEWLARKPSDAATRLSHDQRTGGDVPRLQIALPEAVHPARRHVAQVDRRRPEAAHRPRLADEVAEQTDDLVDALMYVVRKTGDEHRIDQRVG